MLYLPEYMYQLCQYKCTSYTQKPIKLLIGDSSESFFKYERNAKYVTHNSV